MTWPGESTRIKAIINDDEEYAEVVGRLKNVRVLYIDDFFKPVKDELGRPKPPTAADVRLAYELLDHRYINRMPRLSVRDRGHRPCDLIAHHGAVEGVLNDNRARPGEELQAERGGGQ